MVTDPANAFDSFEEDGMHHRTRVAPRRTIPAIPGRLDPAIIARHAEAVAWARRMLTRVRALHESAGPSWTKAVRNLAEREALQAGTEESR